jgi:hypothetical protein
MSIIQGTAKSGGSASFYDYPIEQSLRFDGSSYLSRTNLSSVTDESKVTISLWYKIGSRLGLRNSFFDTYAGGSGSGGRCIIFTSVTSDQFFFGVRNDVDSAWQIEATSSAAFRDPSAWYHFVIMMDTGATNKLIVYANGVEIIGPNSVAPTVTTFTQPFINKASRPVTLGRGSDATEPFSGYLANIQFIDGQALDASYFGETKQDIWVPKAYTGSYGDNGFHLDFADSSNIGNDVSGNNNDWTVT